MTSPAAKTLSSGQVRGLIKPYLIAFAMMALAILLRRIMDPWLGDHLAFLTVYGAVPCAVWITGWRPALLASLLGFLACLFWFVQPREAFGFDDSYVQGASIGYLITSSLIIFLGETAQRARRRAEEHAKTLEILNQTCITLSNELELEKLLDVITDAGREVSGAAFGAFFYNTKDERGETYTLYTLSGVPKAAFEGFPMPRNTAVFEPTFRGGGVIRVGDILQDERYGKNAPNQGMPLGHLPVRSYIAASVVSPSGEVIGGLFYGHPDPDIFTEEVEKILSGMAAQAAVAIEKAKLYQEAQAELNARKESETAMRAAKEQAEAANAAKNRFLALISHELRTPLNPALMIASENAESADIPEEIREDFKTISRSLMLEARLIDDLLDISRVIEGKLKLEFAHHNVHPIVRQAYAVIAADLKAPSAKVEFDFHDEDLLVSCDPVRLQQVIWNLLRNAFSHSPPDGIVFVQSRKGVGKVELTIRDMGTGIHSDELEMIFEAFEHSRATLPSGRGKRPGLGVGLAVCRGIVSAHGGRIWAESEGLGKGATFSVELNTLGLS